MTEIKLRSIWKKRAGVILNVSQEVPVGPDSYIDSTVIIGKSTNKVKWRRYRLLVRNAIVTTLIKWQVIPKLKHFF